MSRNKEKDAAEKARRAGMAMESAFELFAEKGIELVTMPDIAEASGVGRPSLYRYFSTKTDLVIAIGAWKWREYIERYSSLRSAEEREQMTAAQRLRWYMDSYIDLYRNHKDILRFNYFFNSFIVKEQVTLEQKRSYLDVIGMMQKIFHELYEKGMKDGTLRSDLPESVMLSSSFHIMLAAVTRYAVGLVYIEDEADPERELVLLEEALLSRYVVE